MIVDVCTTQEKRDTTVRRLLREQRLKRALEEYEKFVSIMSYKFAWGNHADREDFKQEGREAVWRAVMTLEAKADNGTHQYFRVAVYRAMIDYNRKLRRRNYEVWEYTGPPPKVKRYRYDGKWKAKIKYHPDKLERVTYEYEPQPSVDASGGEALLEDLERYRGKRARSSVEQY